MSETTKLGFAPKRTLKPPDIEGHRGSFIDRNTDQLKQNLETLLWIGMEIDGSGAQSAVMRNRPLRYCSCRNGERK